MHDTTLDHLFAKYNYGVVETDCPFLDIYLHTKDPVCTPVVVIIDAEAAAAGKPADTRYEEKDRIRAGEPYTLNAENIAMISDQLQQMLIDNTFDNCEYLYILMTEDDSLGRKLFPDRKNYWQIIPSQGILQAYEDVDTLFSPLQKDLEQFLQEGPERTSDLRSVLPAMRSIFVTLLLVAVNILLFVYGDLIPGKRDALFSMGALSAELVFDKQEWYRLFTSMFLHISGEHIFNNMITLIFIGAYLERRLGHIRYLILYLVSGLLAGCTSIVYNVVIHSASTSVGASGAIYGLMGALILALIFHHDRQESPDLRQIIFMIFWIVYGSFAIPNVDFAAHIGGLISGFAMYTLLTLSKEKGI